MNRASFNLVVVSFLFIVGWLLCDSSTDIYAAFIISAAIIFVGDDIVKAIQSHRDNDDD